MKLYFIPFACSLAARIALIEAELDCDFVMVMPGSKLPDGRPFAAVSPMGYVPALETRGGLALSEGPAVLTYIADLAAEGVLAPPPYSDERYQMMRWLNFVSTELHKGVFAPLMTTRSSDGARAWARSLIEQRFALLSDHLAGQDYLAGSFSVADAYLLAVLNWCEHAGVAIGDWPVLAAWREKTRARPSVAQAMREEMPLRHAA
ncbi:glutathione binding-like protein [Sphingomonas sp. AR_OL41]|uniref:glutathione S-transferase C-terminal domain-containing protein n=1 Tax=Sphingomonas sp. AR_OL41 TaxID=3042729 RepID=UPI002480B5C2|nr:glutathione binding-like protein [Sphingomonas sp. AR_OL41]MDH7974081.1 glutathione binding-like protein [Sphingomonas sp. AR_OL41]